jgi:hypothetical protein
VIGGFSDIRSGTRDYGMGVVRLDPRVLSGDPAATGWGRHTLLRLTAEAKPGRRHVYAVLRAIDPSDLPDGQELPLLCLEYDDRLLLGVEKGESTTVRLSQAGLWGRFHYFRNHPNIVVRSYTRYTFMTGIFTALLGAMTWALFRKFGL